MTDYGAGEPAALITPYQDGPLIVRGSFQIQAPDGTPIPAGRRTVALCRCGRSALKPFCDGSHARAGFRAAGGRERGPSDAADDGTGSLCQ
jgi:CDGSH-type Zn-finger protein